jgi:hypothetical protein
LDRRLAEIRILKAEPPVHPALWDGFARKMMNSEKRYVEDAPCPSEPFENSNPDPKHPQCQWPRTNPKAPENPKEPPTGGVAR